MVRYADLWRDEPEDGEDVCCPECGETLGLRDRIYTHALCDAVVGCSSCLAEHNALEWFEAGE